MQKTLVLIKPDGVKRSLAGNIIKRFEEKGLKISALKMMHLDDAIINDHYKHHLDRPFFPNLKAYMTSAPLIAIVLQGKESISIVRKMSGATNPVDALPGTIRGDFALSMDGNILHTSDSEESAKEEIARFFKTEDIFDYEKPTDSLL